MVTVTKPSASTTMRQESIQVVVVFFSFSSGSNEELAPDRLQARREADAGQQAGGAQAVALASIAAKSICANTLSTTV